MKHFYLYIILTLCLTAGFFLGGCAQDLQTPDTAENDVEILSETAAPSAVPTVSPSPAPAESETQHFPDALPKPEGNAQESEEARRALYERAEPLYQNQLSLLDSTFKDELYYPKEDDVRLLDRLSSLGTAYPIAVDEAGLYEAGPKGVRKWIIKMEEGSPELVAVEAAYVSYDEDGNSSYSAI